MKPWLLNILACPLDKHHPLEAFFFKWETSESEIEKIAAEAGLQQEELEDKYKILVKQLGDGTISHASMEVITDRTGSKATQGLRQKMLSTLGRKGAKSREELDIIYRYMNMLELSEGLLVCPECNRWYPIGCNVETIPELMPDELREKDKELEWLEKWRILVPENVLRKSKPFSPD